MNHYFNRDNHLLDSKKRHFQCVIGNQDYHFSTDVGVFSKTGLDFGTRLLLETLLPHRFDRVLDLGCGYGPIGIVFTKAWEATVLMTDINRRAIDLAKENAQLNHVEPSIIESDGFSHVEGPFDLIVTNPPIRAGKKLIYDWFSRAKDYLSDHGALVFVIRKDQGAPSAIDFCRQIYSTVETIAKKSGYFIVKCQK